LAIIFEFFAGAQKNWLFHILFVIDNRKRIFLVNQRLALFVRNIEKSLSPSPAGRLTAGNQIPLAAISATAANDNLKGIKKEEVDPVE